MKLKAAAQEFVGLETRRFEDPSRFRRIEQPTPTNWPRCGTVDETYFSFSSAKRPAWPPLEFRAPMRVEYSAIRLCGFEFIFVVEHCSFEFVSDFELRDSDFPILLILRRIQQAGAVAGRRAA
jgi:hypothetical protein